MQRPSTPVAMHHTFKFRGFSCAASCSFESSLSSNSWFRHLRSLSSSSRPFVLLTCMLSLFRCSMRSYSFIASLFAISSCRFWLKMHATCSSSVSSLSYLRFVSLNSILSCLFSFLSFSISFCKAFSTRVKSAPPPFLLKI